MSNTLIPQAGTVCDYNFSDVAASVICSEMGYENMTYWSSGASRDMQESYPIVLGKVDCTEEDVSFSDCSVETRRSCSHKDDVFLVCGRQGK